MNPSLNKAKMNQKAGAASFPGDERSVPRGVYAHRMGEVADDERRVAEFWRDCGFEVEAIEDVSERFSRRPDLRLSKDGAGWAYCEVKTIWRHRWTIRILDDEDQAVEERVEESNAPVSERISGDLVTAFRQLKAGNPDHALLNVVVMVNRDAEASFELLTRALAHEPHSFGGTLQAKRTAMLAKEMEEFRRCVDLCLWTVERADGRLAAEGCVLFTEGLREQVKAWTGLDSGKQIILKPAA